jgi:putative colanic acid biosysnthesis UDP-glucose lipid carrier transferase
MSRSRMVDVIVAFCCLALLTPLIVLIALGVRLNSPGTVVVRSTRRRGDGTGFSFVRFRTNDPDSNQATEFGRFLRRNTLDRLPALVSLMRGEITLRDWRDISREPGA